MKTKFRRKKWLFIVLQKSFLLSMKIYTYTYHIRPPHCDNICRKCLSSRSTENEFKNHQKVCLEDEPYKMKFSK